VQLISLSNKSGEGIQTVKEKACEILLRYRMEQKVDSLAGGSASAKFDEQFLRGMQVAVPKVAPRGFLISRNGMAARDNP